MSCESVNRGLEARTTGGTWPARRLFSPIGKQAPACRIVMGWLALLALLLDPLSARAEAEPPSHLVNPILPGFHPDPSVIREGEDYYVVTSSFEWFPGIPIYHSKDLVNWRQIGNVLDRPTQLDTRTVGRFGGVRGPTIRHHEGTFYVIASQADEAFFVTSTNAAGPWSEPIRIPNSPGIDPSLFFDEDGKAYYCAALEPGHPNRGNAIYLHEIDLASGRLLPHVGGPIVVDTDDTGRVYLLDGDRLGIPAISRPHIHKIEERYVLLCSGYPEFSTQHGLFLFRGDDIWGPYQPFEQHKPILPVLTHQGRDSVVSSVGCGDIVRTRNGEWWGALAGIRRRNNDQLMGRETFLQRFVIDDGWPIPHSEVPLVAKRPDLTWHPFAPLPSRDDFEANGLAPWWNQYKTPDDAWWSLEENPGWLRLHLTRATYSNLEPKPIIARRITEYRFEATTKLNFTPGSETEEAGLIVLMKPDHHYRISVTRDKAETVARLIRVDEGTTGRLASRPLGGDTFCLRIRWDGWSCRFFAGTNETSLLRLGPIRGGRLIGQRDCGGYNGAYVGMFAHTSGQTPPNHADFDWFDYEATAPTLSEQRPYQGHPSSIPGTIQVEAYDEGGPGVAYCDRTYANEGHGFRRDEIDIRPTQDAGGGFQVGWNNPGEWLEYTVMASAGIYDMKLRVASAPQKLGKLDVSLGDRPLGTFNIRSTGGLQKWRTLTIPRVVIPTNGPQVMRLKISGKGQSLFDMNWIRFE